MQGQRDGSCHRMRTLAITVEYGGGPVFPLGGRRCGHCPPAPRAPTLRRRACPTSPEHAAACLSSALARICRVQCGQTAVAMAAGRSAKWLLQLVQPSQLTTEWHVGGERRTAPHVLQAPKQGGMKAQSGRKWGGRAVVRVSAHASIDCVMWRSSAPTAPPLDYLSCSSRRALPDAIAAAHWW